MAFTLRISDGTSTLFTLTDDVNSLVTGLTAGSGDDTVSDLYEALLIGGLSTVVTNVRLLARLLQEAALYYEKKVGTQYYLEKLDQSSGSAYLRSPLYGGNIIDDIDQGISVGKMTIRLTVVRANYWEASSEMQIPLTNSNGTSNTTGLRIYNCNDNSGSSPNRRVNYLEIAAASVGGDLPAAARLELTNTYNNTARMWNVWVAHNVNSDPQNLTHILEGEASSYGTQTSSSTCSGGYYMLATWSGSSEARLYAWTLSTTLLGQTKGNMLRFMARLAVAPSSGIYVRLKVRASISTIYESGPVLLGTGLLQELPALRLPPYLIRSGSLYPLTLELYGQRTTTGSSSLALDFLQICATDSWRALKPFGYGAEYNVRLIDDNILDEVYTDTWSTAGKFGNYVGAGSKLLLTPAKVQRLYVLQSDDSGGGAIVRTCTAKLFYRPRYKGM